MSIGYAKRSIDEVIGLLEARGVRFLVDVRSAPWSQYQPDFSRDALARHVEERGITYLFLGEELGGRPKDADCYDAKGRVDYEACRRRPAFQRGIGRLLRAWEGGHRVALLCSESRPQECHRSKLLGAALREAGVAVMHVDENDAMVSQEEVMERLSGGQLPLFDDLPSGRAIKSRGRYRATHD